MLKEKTGIGPGLFFMVLYVSIFGFGVMQAPHVAAEHMGHNGYWGFILAFILSIPVTAGIAWLGRHFPNRSVIEYLPQLFGVFFGKVLGFLILTAILVLMVWTSRMINEEVRLYFLSRTPVWASIALFLLVALFLARQGIEGITRLAAFVFPLTFVLNFLAILFSLQNFELDNIRPVFFFENGLAVGNGAVHLFYPFLVLLTALMINPYLTKKKKGLQSHDRRRRPGLFSNLTGHCERHRQLRRGRNFTVQLSGFRTDQKSQPSICAANLWPVFRRHLVESSISRHRLFLLSLVGRGGPMVTGLKLQMVYADPLSTNLFFNHAPFRRY